MKVQFSDGGQVRPPVRPAQAETRGARSRRAPVLSFLLVGAAVAAIGFFGYRTVRSSNVYTYGIVTAPLQELRPPFTGRIQNLEVRRGDRISEGDLLFTVTSEPSAAEVRARRNLRESLEKRAETLQAEAETKRDYKVEQARIEVERLAAGLSADEAQRASEIQYTELEFAKLEGKFSRAEAEQRNAKRKAEIEVEKLLEFRANRVERHAKLVQMHEMDAAVASDVAAAKNLMALAGHNLAQAREDLQLAQSSKNPYKKELDQTRAHLDLLNGQESPHGYLLALAKKDLESALAEEPAIDVEVEQSKLELEIAQSEPQTISFHADFNGVVTEVALTNGSLASPQTLVLTAENTENLWLDTYIRDDRATYLEPGREVTVILPGENRTLIGIIADGKTTVVRTPEILSDKLGKRAASIYARIELEPSPDLVPNKIVQVVIPRDALHQTVAAGHKARDARLREIAQEASKDDPKLARDARPIIPPMD